MEELPKSYKLTHSPDGWRVIFSTGIAPGFDLAPHYSLFDVIDRVETLYPEYRPHLTVNQLAEHQLQVARREHAQELQKIISQAGDLKDGLIDLTRMLPQIGVSQDREIAEGLVKVSRTLGSWGRLDLT